jgi:protein-disulfide isomerase
MKVFFRAGVSLAAALLCACSTYPTVDEAKDEFKATFRKMPVDRVEKSELPGLYEVYSGGKLFYFAPEQKLMLFGEMYTTAGQSLTQAKVGQYISERTLNIPQDVGVTVGDGPVEVTGFLDPDCGHCAQAHDWLEKRDYSGVKLRVVFLPLQPGSMSYARAQQFVCSPPELRREALREVYSHEDPAPGRHFLTCAGGAAQLAKQADLAKELGIEGTPTFVAKGQTVLGFNRERLEALLTTTSSTN